MKVQVILVAAGAGKRLKAAKPKAFVLLKGKPLIWYALTTFEHSKLIKSVILVVHKNLIHQFRELVAKNRFKKVDVITPGGKTRSESVACGLRCLDTDADVVMVHDAARPFVTERIIRSSLHAMQTEPATVVAVPAKATIKKVDRRNLYVQETLARDTLWEIQTPQTFKKQVLVKAHAAKNAVEPTDDAMLVEDMGVPVKIIRGDYRNIKITTIEDLKLAEVFLGGNS
jgi:2-C-methyl-D-erythritol 4-phosphate cytidylyltransferase